jgi:hypothetical protein
VVTEDLFDAQCVADILGLSHRNTVFQYQRRYDDMPDRLLTWGRGGLSSGSALSSSAGALVSLRTAGRTLSSALTLECVASSRRATF